MTGFRSMEYTVSYLLSWIYSSRRCDSNDIGVVEDDNENDAAAGHTMGWNRKEERQRRQRRRQKRNMSSIANLSPMLSYPAPPYMVINVDASKEKGERVAVSVAVDRAWHRRLSNRTKQLWPTSQADVGEKWWRGCNSKSWWWWLLVGDIVSRVFSIVDGQQKQYTHRALLLVLIKWLLERTRKMFRIERSNGTKK